jgi:hypothetical protein
MNKLIAALTLTALCSFAQAATAASAAPANTYRGFLTGKYYRGGSPQTRTAYVIGVLDGFSYAPAFGAPNTKIGKLQLCISAMQIDAKQLSTVVDQYLDAHPESWGEQMQPIVLRAMRQTCATHGNALD